MSLILGIDTSNYTTSAALYDSSINTLFGEKMFLPVKSGERGIRQSDAVFHHTKQLSEVIKRLMSKASLPIDLVCASVSPTWQENSYMPCFLVGCNTGECISNVLKCEYIKTTHQLGHIFAAAYSAKRFDLIQNRQPFLAFHVSGGTTDCVYVDFDKSGEVLVSPVAKSSDLKAGQAVDRVGVMLGLDFPCGEELERLAEKSDKHFKINTKILNGNCSLSGVENKCREMFAKNENREDIAAYCIEYIYTALRLMTQYQINKRENLPIVFAGGVMSNKIIAQRLKNEFENAYFATPDFSRDNAYGVCLYAAYIKGLI